MLLKKESGLGFEEKTTQLSNCRQELNNLLRLTRQILFLTISVYDY